MCFFFPSFAIFAQWFVRLGYVYYVYSLQAFKVLMGTLDFVKS